MRETKAKRAERLNRALEALAASHPDAKPELDFSSPYELLVATMLSAQCTDKQVNKATRVLFAQHNTPESIASMDEAELEPFIKSCGFYRTKGKHIIETSRILVEKYAGEVPHERDTLMQLPGVGRKTANVVVSNAFGASAIAVDTHVFRVSNRIGLAQAKDVLETERQLMANIPEDKWSIAHHWLIFHGRRVCSARNPKCDVCAVREYCEKYISENKD